MTYVAERIYNIDEFLARAERLGPQSARTPFQTPTWLDIWFRTIGRDGTSEPALIALKDDATGNDVMLLPLVLRRTRGLRVIMFADRSVSDYCFPILGPNAPSTLPEAAEAWYQVSRCLPKADLISLNKMPETMDGAINPLALLAVARPESVRNFVALPKSWDEYMNQRSHKFRKTIRQKARALRAEFNADFRVITDLKEARERLEALADFQRARFEELDINYVLDKPPFCNFFRELIGRGLPGKLVVLATLEAKGVIVAAALTLRHQKTATMVRLSHKGGEWAKYSPSFVLVGDMLKWLIEDGVETFDFGAGEYDYKQRFGCEIAPLVTFERAMSIRGRGALVGLWARHVYQTSATIQSIAAFAARHFKKRRAGSTPPATLPA